MSTSIIIQNVDEKISNWLHEKAKMDGVDIEKIVIDLIQKEFSKDCDNTQQEIYHDLDSLAGTWNEEQTEEFMKAVTDFEQVDDPIIY